MDGISDLSTYTISICVYAILHQYTRCVPKRAVINGSEYYLRSTYVSKNTNRQFRLYILEWEKMYELWIQYFWDSAICSHALETDSFLEYALPCHSWSDGNGSCRNLQRRAPYLSITIIMQTTKRVRQAVAGQKTCKPIIRNCFYAAWDYCLFATSVACSCTITLKQLADKVATVFQSLFLII